MAAFRAQKESVMINHMRDEGPLITSIVIVSVISMLLFINQPGVAGQAIERTTVDIIITAAYSITSSVYIMLAIRLIRGKVIKVKKSPYIDKELNVWGYLWRYFVIAWVSSFTIIITLFLPIHTASGKAIFTAFLLLFIPLVTLLIFGEDRINKVKMVISYLRGMPSA
jgi:hypothetical protein